MFREIVNPLIGDSVNDYGSSAVYSIEIFLIYPFPEDQLHAVELQLLKYPELLQVGQY